jgi:transposase
MGRSRGGLTTKIHAVVDANGNPIALKLSEGQAHDGRSAADMLDSVGPGQILLADRAYDSDALRQTLADRGAWANVKPMPGRVNVPVRRALLQQAQTFQGDRHALRKTRRQLSCTRQTRRRENLDALYESVT